MNVKKSVQLKINPVGYQIQLNRDQLLADGILLKIFGE